MMREKITYEFSVKEYRDINHLIDDLEQLIEETNKEEYRIYTDSDFFKNMMAIVGEVTIKIPQHLEYV